VLAALPAQTVVAQERSGTSTPFSCTTGYDDGGNLTVPTARTAGTALYAWVPVRNHDSVTMPDPFLFFTMIGDVQRAAPLPTVWWRVAGGRWSRAAIRWTASSTYTHGSSWVSGNLYVGNIPAKSTRWVQMSLTFPQHSIKGTYDGMFYAGAVPCGPYALSWYQQDFEYWPWHGLEGHPA
jgi:hypothetical protein